MKQFTYTITNPLGIHGRPAVELVQAAKSFRSEIILEKGGRSTLCTRMMALMSLCVKCGDLVTITIQGEDEETAAPKMEAFFHAAL